MAGPQHPFPTGFPNAQQNTMRNQFAGGQMVPGLMSPQQGMMNPQQFGGGVGGVGVVAGMPGVGGVGGVGVGVGVGGVGSGVSPNSLGILNPQQVMGQPQPMQQQMQQQQQMHLQQQQQQQNTLMPPNNQPGVTPSTPQIPVPQAQQPPQRQPNREINTITLCRLGQENVQEIVARMQEFFQILKQFGPPNGTQQGQNMSVMEKKKLEELLKSIGMLFKRLRMIYERCNENCQLQGMEYTHIESLIPIKEEWDMKSDEKKASEAYRVVIDEYKEVMDSIILKNRHLKDIIDHMRRIISEINTMMMMRRS